MATDLTELKASVASLLAVVATVPPLLASNADLTAKAIATIETLVAQQQSAGTDPQAIADVVASINATLAELRNDANGIAAQNVALQAELDKVAPPPAPPAPAA